MVWSSIQQEIRACRRCETGRVVHLRVPAADKRKPPREPVRPVRLYFVSVAPPWGGAYFWDETRPDSVREGLFKALEEPLGLAVTSCRQFLDQRLFLTPAVKCPSEKGGNNHQPSRSAAKNCARFLHSELVAADPERILALGRRPFESLRDIFQLDAPTGQTDSQTHLTIAFTPPTETYGQH